MMRIISGTAALLLALSSVSCALLPETGNVGDGTGIAVVDPTEARTDLPTAPDLTDAPDETDTADDTAETDAPEETGGDPGTEETSEEPADVTSQPDETSGNPGTSGGETGSVTTAPEETTAAPGGPVTKVTVTLDSKINNVGMPIYLSAHVYPENALNTDVKWSIYYGGEYARISDDGVLEAWKATRITVKCASKSNPKVYALLNVVPEYANLWEGKGTKASPYLIKTASDLANITYSCYRTGVYFRQTKDIDLSSYGVWTPIGYGHGSFVSYYDGDGHKITGLTLGDLPGDPYRDICTDSVGLFAEIDGGTPISNLTVEASGGGNGIIGAAGIICGRCGRGSIKNVNVTGSISFPNASYVGGLCGEMTGDIAQCSSKADVSCGGPYVGGLCGYLNGSMSKSFADCSVKGAYFVGGAVGYAEAGCVISNCYSAGSVASPVLLSSWRPCGGLIGCVTAAGTATKPDGFHISYCYTRASVDAACDSEYSCALIGYVLDSLTKETSVAGKSFSAASGFKYNYSLGDADEFAHPREFPEGYVNYKKYVSKQYRVTTNVTEEQLLKTATFKNWDFKSVWKMGKNGPELVGF